MGVLLSAVAVRSDDADEVVDVFLSMMRRVGHQVQPLPGPHPRTESSDVLCTASGRGWVTLVPHYIVQSDKLAAELTRRLGTVASAVGVYEDVLWMHHLVDRGVVREGFRADLVLFEENGIRPRLPTVEKDLPGGARRLVQKAEGIKATVVNGAVAFEDGEATGAYAGQVLKGKIAS